MKNENHYTPLGYDHGTFYYLSHASQQVIALAASSHSMSAILQLAPLKFWEQMFPGRSKVPLDVVQNYLFSQCYAKGVYDPSKIRGRGCWWDAGRSVMHAGDRLIVDGEWIDIPSFETKYIYEASKPIEVDIENPLGVDEASLFGHFLTGLSWTDPIAARLCAGWCVCALVAGSLQWHPHLWIVAKAGSGKSWTMDKVISEILLGFAQEFKSSVTTEPGIRRSLMGSSLPVMLDDPDGAAQINKIIELMRACSQSGRAKAAQGGGENGAAVQFELLSCFICSSVVIPFVNEADVGRITVLSLDNSQYSQQEQERRFIKLKIDRAELLTEDYCKRFQSRAILMIPTIRKSVETFSIAASRVLGNRRGGDQIGTLLAGAWSLISDDPPTLDEATAWIAEREMIGGPDTKPDNDETVCLRNISQYMLTLDGGIKRRVDELVRVALRPKPQKDIRDKLTDEEKLHEEARDEATYTLRRYGILCVYPETVCISNNDIAIKRMLKGTPFENNWNSVLLRLPGAEKMSPKWFGDKNRSGSAQRSVGVPLSTFIFENPPKPAEAVASPSVPDSDDE